MRRPAVARVGEQCLQLERERRGEGRRVLVVDDPVARRAQPRVQLAGMREDRAHEVGGGRLAVGAGDAREREVFAGAVEGVGGDRGDRGARVVDLDAGARGDPTSLDDHDCRARVADGGDEVVGVAGLAADRDEKITGRDFAGVGADSGDLRIRRALDVGRGRDVGQEGAERGHGATA